MWSLTICRAIPTLKLDADTIAGIFLGQIKKWNDPKLTALNPDAKLPDQEIVVVHRSDGSGTTYIWTDYLSKISPEWKTKVGTNTSVNWPTGIGGKGNEGVAGQVKQTPGRTWICGIDLCSSKQNAVRGGEKFCRQIRKAVDRIGHRGAGHGAISRMISGSR